MTEGLPAARPLRLSVERKIQVGFGVAIALVVAVGAAALRSTAGTVASARWVSHTLEVETTLQETLRNLIDAETGGRGFALTGRDAFLEPYDSARAHTGGLITHLRALTADNPVQQRRVAELDSLAGVRFERMADLIAARRRLGLQGAARQAATGAGKAVMDRIRGVIVAMDSTERQLLGLRQDALQASARLARRVTWLGTALAVAVALVAGVLIRRDLAGRRRAEQAVKESQQRVEERTVALHQSESRYRVLFDSIDEGYCIIEMIFDEQDKPVDYRFVEINPAFEGQTGLHDAVGKRMRELAPQHEEHWFETYGRIAVTGEAVRFQNRAEQLHRWYDVYACRVGDPKHRQVAIVFRDITERKAAEAAIDRLNAELSGRVAELRGLNRELEAFSYSVSHDLRAPLRSIDGFSRILLEDYAPQLDAAAQDSLHRIRAATQRMAELIDDMLSLARVSRAELKREVVDLSALARAIADDLRRAEPERQVDVVIADGLVTEGDARLLRAVLENLLGNAWKFSRQRPRARIEVGVQSGGDGGRAYYVRDDGAGFDMAYAGKLFGVFQRLHGMTEFEGTGVGLATVQRIVHRHGGRVWAEGAVGRGATFYFTLSSDEGPHGEADAAARRG